MNEKSIKIINAATMLVDRYTDDNNHTIAAAVLT